MSAVIPGIVLFGGLVTPLISLDDTWAWNGSTWIQQNPQTVPPERDSSAMSADPPHRNVVMFGGAGVSTFLGDTWTWDGTDWTEHLLSFPNAPTARLGHSMAYSSDRNAVVLFGGQTMTGVLEDTWLWDGFTWTDITDSLDESPTARQRAAMASADGTVYLVGGFSATTASLNDTWRLDPGTWTNITTINPGRFNMPGSSFSNGLVIAGGDMGAGALTDATEEFDPTTSIWTLQAPLPTPRQQSGASTEPQTGAVILFGGSDESDTILNQTLRYTGTTWSLLAPSQNPPARRLAAMATIFCMGHSTLILMMDGTYKPIQDIRKGDYVKGDFYGTTYRVVKLIKQDVTLESETDIVIFKKNALGRNLPSNKLIVLGNHSIIWNGKKRPAGRFMNHPNVTRYYHQRVLKRNSTDNKIYSLFELLPDEGTGTFTVYDLQFETEGSYVAEGLQMKSRSPLSKFTPLDMNRNCYEN